MPWQDHTLESGFVRESSKRRPAGAESRATIYTLEYHFVSLGGGALQYHIDAQAAKLGTKLKVRIALRSFNGICRMAGEGVGIGLVPEKAARRYKRITKIGILPLQDDWATRRLSMCLRSEKDLTSLALDLFRHLAGEGQREDR